MLGMGAWLLWGDFLQPWLKPGRSSNDSFIRTTASLGANMPLRPSHDLIETAILVLGAQRSGTTWLGKILDSNPGVLYRHEPDELLPPVGWNDPASVRATVASWISERRMRSAAKQPFFRKSWQSAPCFALRGSLVFGLKAGARLPLVGRTVEGARVPDLGSPGRQRAVIKSIQACELAGTLAQTLPDSRTLLIMRHPYGQVSSILRGTREGRFSSRKAGTRMPYNEMQAMTFAACRGISNIAFQRLPDAAKYAWSWRAFNETAFTALDGLPNAKVVVYEELCARPEAEARAILAFTGLDWTAQTAGFVACSSSHAGDSGYYGVLRTSTMAAKAWQSTMPLEDLDAVQRVVAGSPLAWQWPDITAT